MRKQIPENQSVLGVWIIFELTVYNALYTPLHRLLLLTLSGLDSGTCDLYPSNYLLVLFISASISPDKALCSFCLIACCEPKRCSLALNAAPTCPRLCGQLPRLLPLGSW